MSVITFPLACRRCKADVQGQPWDGFCPSCGHSVSEGLLVKAINPVSLTVQQDVTCIHCQYNLRTLSLGGKCPECGQRVRDSLQSNDLRYADSYWLGKVNWGLRLLMFGQIGMLLLLEPIFLFPPYSLLVLYSLFFLAIGLGFIFFGLWVKGVRNVTLPQPLNRESKAGEWIHELAVFSTILAMVFPVVMVFGGGKIFSNEKWIFPVSLLTIGTFSLVASGCVLLCLHRLARTAGIRNFAGMTLAKFALSAVTIITCLLVPFCYPIYPMVSTSNDAISMWRMAGCLILINGIFSIRLLVRYRRMIQYFKTSSLAGGSGGNGWERL